MLRFTMMLAVLALAGCALGPEDYYGAGQTREQVMREAADCEMKAESGSGNYSTIYDACMRSKGFERR